MWARIMIIWFLFLLPYTVVGDNGHWETCFSNTHCSCVYERPDFISELTCKELTEFPKFTITGPDVSVVKMSISGDLEIMPHTGLDMFKKIDHLIIERSNDAGYYIVDDGQYTLTNCNIDALSLMAFLNPLPLESGQTAIDPQTVEKLTSLTVERSPSIMLDDNTFTSTKSLTHLALPSNSMRDHNFKNEKIFDPIKEKLVDLDLSRNKLSYDSKLKSALERLNNLRVLRLNENAIKDLDDVDFSFAPMLRILALNGNAGLSKLDKSHFSQNQTSLHEFYLHECALTEIPDALEYMPTLRILDLSQNDITHLRTDAFFRNVILEQLNLDNNPIVRIESGAFHELVALTNFSIHNWKLETLDLSVFTPGQDGVGKLENLRIKNNPQLHTITVSDAASVPRSLRRIEINGNNLTTLNKSVGSLMKENPNLVMAISNEHHFDCQLDNGQSDPENAADILTASAEADDGNGSHVEEHNHESNQLIWLAELAACTGGERIVIEDDVFCAPNRERNESFPLLQFLHHLEPNCSHVTTTSSTTTTRVPKTTTSKSGGHGGGHSYRTTAGSWLLFVFGLLIFMGTN